MSRAPARKPATAPRKPATRDRVADLSERFAAMEAHFSATMEVLPDRMALAIKEGIAELAPKSEVLALQNRVAILEGKQSFAAGAVKVEERVRGTVQDWIRTLTPLLWPIVVAILATRFAPIP